MFILISNKSSYDSCSYRNITHKMMSLCLVTANWFLHFKSLLNKV